MAGLAAKKRSGIAKALWKSVAIPSQEKIGSVPERFKGPDL